MIFLVFFLCAFLIGLILIINLIENWIFNDIEIKDKKYVLSLSFTIGLSIMLYSTFLFHLIKFISVETSVQIWNIAFTIAIFNAQLVLPFLIFNEFFLKKNYKLLSRILINFLLLVLIQIGIHFIHFKFINSEQYSLLSIQIESLELIGAIISGTLTGFAGVRSVFTYFLQRNDQEQDKLDEYIEQYNSTLTQMCQCQVKSLTHSKPKQKGIVSNMLKIFSNSNPEDEYLTLSMVQYELYLKIYNIWESEELIKFYQTFLGKMQLWTGKIIGVYSIYGFLQTIYRTLISSSYFDIIESSHNNSAINLRQGWLDLFREFEEQIIFLFVFFIITSQFTSAIRNLILNYKKLYSNSPKYVSVENILTTSSYILMTYIIYNLCILLIQVNEGAELRISHGIIYSKNIHKIYYWSTLFSTIGFLLANIINKLI